MMPGMEFTRPSSSSRGMRLSVGLARDWRCGEGRGGIKKEGLVATL